MIAPMKFACMFLKRDTVASTTLISPLLLRNNTFATALQAELASSKKALRQAVNQLQALEAEQGPDNIPSVLRGGQERGGNGGNRNSSHASPSGPYPSTPQQPTNSSSSFSSNSSSFSSTPSSTPGGGTSGSNSSGNGVGDRVARIRLRMQELLAEVGRQGALLHQRDLRIADLEADASRHAAAYAQALATMPPSSTSSSSSSSGGGRPNASSPRRSGAFSSAANGAPSPPTSTGVASSSSGTTAAAVAPAVQLHELTHLKCAVLEYVLADPEDCAKKQQLTAVMARLLHFTKRETEAALAVANPDVADYDPLSFLGGFLAST